MLIHSCRHVYYSHHDENHHGCGASCCHGEGHHEHGHGEGCHSEGRHGRGHGEGCHSHEHSEGRHGRGEGRRGRGKGLRRLFDHGDLHIMVLSLVAKKPSYGYEIIKDIQEASNGLYVPSPGVIYPTLTLLEEQGFLESQIVERNRKSFTITVEGAEHLAQNKEIEAMITRKLAKARDMQQGVNLTEDIEMAVSRFKALLRHKMVLKQLNEEQTRQIATIINDAVKQIEEVNTLLTDNDDE